MYNLGNYIAELEEEYLQIQKSCQIYLEKAPKENIRVAGGKNRQQYYSINIGPDGRRTEKYISMKNEKLLKNRSGIS